MKKIKKHAIFSKNLKKSSQGKRGKYSRKKKRDTRKKSF